MKWYRKAAEQGNLWTQFRLGEIYDQDDVREYAHGRKEVVSQRLTTRPGNILCLNFKTFEEQEEKIQC